MRWLDRVEKGEDMPLAEILGVVQMNSLESSRGPYPHRTATVDNYVRLRSSFLTLRGFDNSSQ